MIKKMAISPGDPAGIGPDICIKAFAVKKPLNFIPVIFSDPLVLEKRAKELGRKINIKEYSKKNYSFYEDTLFISEINMEEEVVAGIPNPKNALTTLLALKIAAHKTINNEFDALVTGPINKKIMNDGGVPFQGHTEFLAKESKTDQVVMMLTSRNLKIALATTHVPLIEVSGLITKDHISNCLKIIKKDLEIKWKIKNPAIKILGLNPHAGDGGYIGKEEQDILIPLVNQLKEEGFNLMGPDSADTAFTKSNLKGIDAILAMYHDQGLPVIKASSFGEIVNVTLGLPFIRTSVDHGTAYIAAGTGKANEQSLLAAVNLAHSITIT